jgi:hypothetical protein
MLEGLSRGADEIAQSSDVGAISADASGVYRQAKAFGEIEIHAGVVQFRKAKTSGGLHAVHARRIDRTRGTVAVPGTASQLVKLLPVAFVPSVHRFFSSPFLDAARGAQGSITPKAKSLH